MMVIDSLYDELTPNGQPQTVSARFIQEMVHTLHYIIEKYSLVFLTDEDNEELSDFNFLLGETFNFEVQYFQDDSAAYYHTIVIIDDDKQQTIQWTPDKKKVLLTYAYYDEYHENYNEDNGEYYNKDYDERGIISLFLDVDKSNMLLYSTDDDELIYHEMSIHNPDGTAYFSYEDNDDMSIKGVADDDGGYLVFDYDEDMRYESFDSSGNVDHVTSAYTDSYVELYTSYNWN